MKQLELIKSENFGDVEADIYSNGDDMFMTIDQLADCLEYSNGRKGIENLLDRNEYLKNNEFSTTLKLRGVEGSREVARDRRVFTEDGIYEVTMLSGQPKAKEFRAWIRSILKGLRAGKFKFQKDNPLEKEIAEAKLNNSRARISAQWLKLADRVDIPEFKQICASYAGNALAGHEVLSLPVSEQRYMQATEIAKMFGISSNMVGRIANKYGLKSTQYGKWYHDKSPNSNKEIDTFRYNNKALNRFKEIVQEKKTNKQSV